MRAFSYRDVLRQARGARCLALLISCGLGGSVVGCHDLAGTASLPAGTRDPSYYNGATGAIGMRNSAVYYFQQALPPYILQTGLLTDELTSLSAITGTIITQPVSTAGAVTDPVDERILPESEGTGNQSENQTDGVYSDLQKNRQFLGQAIAQLAVSATSAKDRAILPPGEDSVLRGELYALYGLTEIQLADLFCSGIPLSTVDFQKDFTYRSGSPRDSVYWDAVAHLDTALALSGDSLRILNLAQVGLGRAYLDLGLAAAAADDVASVPTAYVYGAGVSGVGGANIPLLGNGGSLGTVAHMEGSNGLPHIGDPRTADTAITVNNGQNYSYYFPKLYLASTTSGTLNVVVASGVEARLIEAEAALRAGDPSWLTILNTLRTSGGVQTTYTRTCQPTIKGANGVVTQRGSPCPDSAGAAPGQTWRDTTWSPGTGAYLLPASVLTDVGPVCPVPAGNGTSLACTDTIWYKGLHMLSDPGIASSNPDSARLALIFRERGTWLFMTGHRQGDLRRQLRQYSQYWPDQSAVYPTGVYLGQGVGFYGSDVTAPIPAAEYLNPYFHGCKNRAP